MSDDARRTPVSEQTDDVATESEERPSSGSATRPPGGGAGSTRRFWSVRRVPAAIVALCLTVIVIALLYEAVAAAFGRTPARWRRGVADELATRPLDDPWMIAGAVLAALLGLWLVVLAVTPGLRGLLPMRGGAPGGVRVRAALARSAAAVAVRDRLLEVPGVQSARVRVGRRRVKVRARAHFRPLEEVRGDLDRAVEEAVRQLGLARRMGLSTRVRRPK